MVNISTAFPRSISTTWEAPALGSIELTSFDAPSMTETRRLKALTLSGRSFNFFPPTSYSIAMLSGSNGFEFCAMTTSSRLLLTDDVEEAPAGRGRGVAQGGEGQVVDRVVSFTEGESQTPGDGRQGNLDRDVLPVREFGRVLQVYHLELELVPDPHHRRRGLLHVVGDEVALVGEPGQDRLDLRRARKSEVGSLYVLGAPVERRDDHARGRERDETECLRRRDRTEGQAFVDTPGRSGRDLGCRP